MSSIAQQLFEEGRLEGLAETKARIDEIIANLLGSTNLTKSEIAANFEVSLQEVEAIANQKIASKPTL